MLAVASAVPEPIAPPQPARAPAPRGQSADTPSFDDALTADDQSEQALTPTTAEGLAPPPAPPLAPQLLVEALAQPADGDAPAAAPVKAAAAPESAAVAADQAAAPLVQGEVPPNVPGEQTLNAQANPIDGAIAPPNADAAAPVVAAALPAPAKPQTTAHSTAQDDAPLTQLIGASPAPKSPALAKGASNSSKDTAQSQSASDAFRQALETDGGDDAAPTVEKSAKSAPPPTNKGDAAQPPNPPQSGAASPLRAVEPAIAQHGGAPTLTATALQTSNAHGYAHSTAHAHAPARQVGHEIIRRFDGESTRFEMRLDPPELGRVDVRLEVTRDQRVSAVVAADNPQALAELTRHARDLELALQSAGLDLAEDGLSFSLRERESQSHERGADQRATREDDPRDTPDEIVRAAPIRLESWRGHRIDVLA